ncbi:MAG: hypothetical protein O2991_01090 [Bacteroidetes bacterium]|nr:hypothetical protein [Bacteroidota bacterium]MDA0907017.1 hypothetical protein [Bacteroidota bacterium]
MSLGFLLAIVMQIMIQGGGSDAPSDLQSAQEARFVEAIEEYRSGQILEAYEKLSQIVSEGGQAPELYFNLGVASSRMGRLGESMGWFLLASEDPRLESEALDAYTSVQEQLPFTIPVLPKTPWQRGYEALQGIFTPNGWSWVLSVGLYIVVLGLGLGWFSSLSWRHASWVSGLGAVIALVASIILWSSATQYAETVKGLVTAESVTLYDEPNQEFPSETIAYEGVEFRVRMGDFSGDLDESVASNSSIPRTEWLPVTLSNGSSGWLPSKDVFLADTRYLGS